eukprot:TRINITY_DN50536_c0_g1_i1.p1 TRINITY_DN50536_c0_g1~~TRINITY_DN50536_c0_g1_i1.p1  ORF type:complete len:434 (+),score=79.55 TRINITY_DN50536_c0_g1_i1:94-1395(+)
MADVAPSSGKPEASIASPTENQAPAPPLEKPQTPGATLAKPTANVPPVSSPRVGLAHSFFQRLGTACFQLEKAKEAPSDQDATAIKSSEDDVMPSRSRRLQDRAVQCAARAMTFRENGRMPLAETQLGRCRKHAEAALELDKSNTGARFMLVGCLMFRGEFAAAKTEALILIESFNHQEHDFLGDPSLHLAIAHLSKVLGQLDEAIGFLEQAAEMFPDYPAPCVALSELLNRTGRYLASADMARTAFERDRRPRCPKRLTQAEKATAACCLAERFAETAETGEKEADVEEDTGVRSRRSKSARPGGLMSLPDVGTSSSPAAASMSPPKTSRDIEQKIKPKDTRTNTRSRAFCPRGPVVAEPVAAGRMSTCRAVEESDSKTNATGATPRIRQPNSARSQLGDLIVREHLPLEQKRNLGGFFDCRGSACSDFVQC